MEAVAEKKYTKEEYFELQEQSDIKLEYHNGLIIEAMAGGSANHSRIQTDLTVLLASGEHHCHAFNSDMAIGIKEQNRYVYPDLSFVCGEDVFEDQKQRFLANPCLIIEVISPSTKDIDRGTKFSWYRSLTSFKEYVLIQSEEYGVESWYKEEEDLWRIQSAKSLDQSIYVHTLGMKVTLKDIYQRVDLSLKNNEAETRQD
ncbi:MAG: Uma2 family endonuclease [Bacteroidota bacterium]